MISVTRSSKLGSFAYTPPSSIFRTVRVLLTLSQSAQAPVIAAALRGLWRFSPLTRVLVTEHPALEAWMLGANMVTVDVDALPSRPYVPIGSTTARPVMASHLFGDCYGCITLCAVDPAALDAPPSLSTIAEYVRGNTDLSAVYHTMRTYFVGAIVQVGEQVIWGDDLLEVDRAVYQKLGKPIPSILNELIHVENDWNEPHR